MFDPPSGNIVTPTGWFRVISRITIYSTRNGPVRARKLRAVRESYACLATSEKPQGCSDSAPRYRSLDVRCDNLGNWHKISYFGDQLGDSLWPFMVS